MKNHIRWVYTTIAIALFSTQFIAQDLPIKIEVKGEGSDVLFLPGFGCPGEVWNILVDELSKSHTCHVVSYAGFNKLPPIEGPWLQNVKDEIEKYITNQEISPTIIGHSLGGTLALWLATENKVSIDQVISVDGLASVGALMIPNFNSGMISHENPMNELMMKMPEKEFNQMIDQMSSVMVLDQTHQGKISSWIKKADRKTYVYGYTDLLKVDLRNSLQKIKVPVNVIAAVHPNGKETVSKNMAEQFKQLNDYSINYAESSAHFIMYDEPEWLENIVKNILSE